jgi:uncharacterized protein YkwD
MRKLAPILTLVCLLVLVPAAFYRVQARPAAGPDLSTASELIAEVNALRAGRGLPAYNPHPILMQIAQTHAEYLASLGSASTHLDQYGRRPFQRALDAGYPVAGDLSRGGFFSENIVAGANLDAAGAVEIWMGDAPHQNTMLSGTLQDVGAGVAVVGNTYFYVLDAGLSTGGTPQPYTPRPPAANQPTPTFATYTPNPDGSITYIVQQGDTLLAIAIAFDIYLDELYALNGLTEKSVIYPGQTLIIRPAHTATPTQPTGTPTPRPTATLWPTSTWTRTPLASPPPAPTQAAALQPSASAIGAVLAIIVTALLAAGAMTFLGRKKT